MSTIEFNQLLISHTEGLKPYAISFTHDGQEANDLVHETLYRALRNREKYNDGTNIRAWLYTIMRNTFINSYRRRNREKKIFHNGLPGFLSDHSGAATSNPAEATLVSKEILTAVHSLPDIFRVPFTLYSEGYKYQEIADILNIALGTIKSRIHLARKSLRGQIAR